MKIVLDTNVFVSSFIGGKPRHIIDHWKRGRFNLCLSADILDEYIRVFEKLDFIEQQTLQQLLTQFKTDPNILFTHSPTSLSVVDTDPDDDKFIACAVELEAGYVVSGDEDLLQVGTYYDIQMLPPAKFLEEITD